MNPSGVVITIAGVWVLCQVFGGNALGRLGISGAPDEAKGKTSAKGGSGLDGSGKTGSGAGGGGGGSW
jgi:hypothetical protein